MTVPLGEHFFRREYGRLTAMLARRFGVHRLEAVEDAVQNALVSALEVWPRTEVPERPAAWLAASVKPGAATIAISSSIAAAASASSTSPALPVLTTKQRLPPFSKKP